MRLATLMLALATLMTTPATLAAETKDELAEQVRNSERAFAKTMADRDLDAFASFLARDSVFFRLAPRSGWTVAGRVRQGLR